MAFMGFPAAAVDFYKDLDDDNSREWWLAHKDVYETAVRQPLTELLSTLEPEFGVSTKIFRPNRDVRFSPDKSPYKTAQGGYIATPGGFAYYVQISGSACWPRGVRGCWKQTSSTGASRPSSLRRPACSWPGWWTSCEARDSKSAANS